MPGETMFEALVHEDRPEGDEMIRSRNSQFDARVEATTTVGPYDAVVPSIAGRAWITSFNQLVLDPTDPLQESFVVGRPWEPEH